MKKQLVLIFSLCIFSWIFYGQEIDQPVIDMHMHAYWDGLDIPNPNTGKLLVQNSDEHRTMSLTMMEKNNVVLGAVSVVHGDHIKIFDVLKSWEEEGGDKILKGLFLGVTGYPSIEIIREWFSNGKYDFFGELALQYDGRSPSDTIFNKYYELALELDVPIGIHTGMSAPGTPYDCCPNFRLSLGNPYLLEDVLVKYPKLRVWAMHAGGQYYNEMVTMMKMYSQLYVDISPYTWLDSGNSELLDRFLKLAKEQEVLDRVMFGSDQMKWPETIEMAINRVKLIDYLNENEKADILYNNAARFLRFSQKTIEKHYGK
jgi:hypothetical protein